MFVALPHENHCETRESSLKLNLFVGSNYHPHACDVIIGLYHVTVGLAMSGNHRSLLTILFCAVIQTTMLTRSSTVLGACFCFPYATGTLWKLKIIFCRVNAYTVQSFQVLVKC